MLKKSFTFLFTSFIMLSIQVIFLICILTPERDKFGNYTDPIKYWTSDTYLYTNFNVKG